MTQPDKWTTPENVSESSGDSDMNQSDVSIMAARWDPALCPSHHMTF